MATKKSRLSAGGMALLLCGVLALTGFFVLPGQRAHADTSAFVRIIHASPYVAAANVYVDGTSFLTSFGFGQVAGYSAIAPGPHKVQISLAKKNSPFVLTETLAVQPGGVYTVAAIGATADTLSLQVFNDSNLATSGMAKVRVYQLSPDAGWMSVLDGSTYETGANYQQASGYLTLSPGSATFNLNSARTGRSLSLTTSLQANQVTSIFAIGMFNGIPQAELVTNQTAALPGLPQTGSNPLAFISDGHLSTPWLLIALALLAVGGTLFTRRLFGTH